MLLLYYYYNKKIKNIIYIIKGSNNFVGYEKILLNIIIIISHLNILLEILIIKQYKIKYFINKYLYYYFRNI